VKDPQILASTAHRVWPGQRWDRRLTVDHRPDRRRNRLARPHRGDRKL